MIERPARSTTQTAVRLILVRIHRDIKASLSIHFCSRSSPICSSRDEQRQRITSRKTFYTRSREECFMAGPMGRFQYISDDGVTYKLKLDAENTQAWYQKGWVPRYLLAENATYGKRKVICPDPADAHWVGGTATLALAVAGVATSPTFTISGRFGEKRTNRG